MKKRICLILSLVLFSACSTSTPPSNSSPTPSGSTSELKRFDGQNYTAGFDTVLAVSLYTNSKEEFNPWMNQSSELFTHYNNLFDIYNTYEGINNVKTINDNAGIEPVKVDAELIDCLLDAKKFYEYSNHEFDITLGAVLQVWHRYREEGITLNESGEKGNLPTEEELETAKACTGWEYVEIDEEANTVYITNPCVSLDVGGIAKGYATEKMANAIEKDVFAGIINAGGNNRTLNTKPDGSDWVSGIQNPDGNGSLLAIPVTGSQSIVTSGDYQRYYLAEDGTRYHHIIDPTTNFPANLYRSVTIITEDSGDADALSTTLYTLSIEEGREVLETYMNDNPDKHASAIWIMDKDKAVEDGNGFITSTFYVTSTEDIKDKIKTID